MTTADPTEQPERSAFPALAFFPEVILFGIAIVLTPVWAVRLFHQGYYAQAIGSATAGFLCGAGFVWFLRKGRRWLAWLVIPAFFFTLWVAASSMPQSALNLWP